MNLQKIGVNSLPKFLLIYMSDKKNAKSPENVAYIVNCVLNTEPMKKLNCTNNFDPVPI